MKNVLEMIAVHTFVQSTLHHISCCLKDGCCQELVSRLMQALDVVEAHAIYYGIEQNGYVVEQSRNKG